MTDFSFFLWKKNILHKLHRKEMVSKILNKHATAAFKIPLIRNKC